MSLRLILISTILHCVTSDIAEGPEDAKLNFKELTIKYGHICEEHKVITKDGYILTVFNVKGDRNKPVLLMHGFLDSADTFIIRGNSSTAITLARAGYDVWVGNARGNKYSRHHIALDPDKDLKFWDFSVHEIGYLDLPAIIDYILESTEQSQIHSIGHSVGTTFFYILGATRPEYNAKIKLQISLGPICYLLDDNEGIKISTALFSSITNLAGTGELFTQGTRANEAMELFCKSDNCSQSIIFYIYGSDFEEFEPDFAKVAIAHQPSGTSVKTAVHLLQFLIRRQFTQYDYGLTNILKYLSFTPPEYDLRKVTMKVAIFVGRNDHISLIKDMEILSRRLPNVVEYRVMERPEFNHLDFIYGKHMDLYLYPYMFDLLKKYN